MTTRERALQGIGRLPADAALAEIVDTLQQMDASTTVGEDVPLPEGGAWDLLERAAGTVEMPSDRASEHDHYLYGTPKRPPLS